MRETLPDVLVDDRMPMLFVAGFSGLLIALVLALIWAAILRERARTAGIMRKYAVPGDDTARRRVT